MKDTRLQHSPYSLIHHLPHLTITILITPPPLYLQRANNDSFEQPIVICKSYIEQRKQFDISSPVSLRKVNIVQNRIKLNKKAGFQKPAIFILKGYITSKLQMTFSHSKQCSSYKCSCFPMKNTNIMCKISIMQVFEKQLPFYFPLVNGSSKHVNYNCLLYNHIKQQNKVIVISIPMSLLKYRLIMS